MLGTGTNIQDRLIAAHHVDCPWRPSDVTQRNGRILRPGNQNNPVKIFYYITKGTFDAYLWQIQEQKLKFIKQIMTGKAVSRRCDDCDETVLTAAEVKAIATNDPLIGEKMKTDNEVMRLKLLKSSWEDEIISLKKDISINIPYEIKGRTVRISRLQEDIQTAQKHNSEEFSASVGNTVFDKRADAGDRILMYSKTLGKNIGDNIEIGSLRGFCIGLRRDAVGGITLELCGSYTYSVDLSFNNAGNLIRLENIIEKLPDALTAEKEKLGNAKKRLEDAKAAVAQPFSEEKELNAMLEKQADIENQIELKREQEQNADAAKSDGINNETEEKAMEGNKQKELYDAINENDSVKAKELIDDGAAIQNLFSGETPLHTAVKAGAGECTDELIKHGAFADAFDDRQNTPLYYAVKSDNLDMAKRLLNAGASSEIKTGSGKKVNECAKSDDMAKLIESYSQTEKRGESRYIRR